MSMYHCVSHEEADKLITQFWVQEEITNACEEFFKSNVQRTEHGRYNVRLPLKESAENLGESYPSAGPKNVTFSETSLLL